MLFNNLCHTSAGRSSNAGSAHPNSFHACPCCQLAIICNRRLGPQPAQFLAQCRRISAERQRIAQTLLDRLNLFFVLH